MTSSHKTAILLGATGLIGGYVLAQLSTDNRYRQVIVISRRPIPVSAAKVTVILSSFRDRSTLLPYMKGDEIYCCLGTTIKKAGSEQAFREVDLALPVLIGECAVAAGIPKMLVVSSLGADPQSSNFYLRTKGEMEQALRKSGIPSLHIFRPSMLLGPRNESRPLETAGKWLMNFFSILFIGPLKKYKAIHAEQVARAMIAIANSETKQEVWESQEMETPLK